MQKREKIKRFLVLVFGVLFAAGFESVTRCFWSFNGADEIQFPVLYLCSKSKNNPIFFAKTGSIPKFKALVKFCHPSQPCGHLHRNFLIQKSIWNCETKFAQSICTHYSCFENMGRFATLKKIRSKIWGSKSRVQKQGHCYSKKEEARLPLLFLNNNDPVFWHPAFCNLFFGPFFLSSRT